MSDPPLPELYQALLDDATLAQLLAEISATSAEVEVVVKARAAGRAEALADGGHLEALGLALTTGAIQGLQLRYRFEGQRWMDTLLHTPAGVRLTRMQAPSG